MHLYPTVEFSTSACMSTSLSNHLFLTHCLTVGYWEEILNRKDFFNNFAQRHAFDPLIPENWYSVSTEAILGMEVSSLSYYVSTISA